MAIQTREQLKQWFETGDFPTQQQFWDWMDSYVHKNEASDGFIQLAPGAVQFVPAVDMVIEMIRVFDPATLAAFKMGTTPGGGEVWDETEVTAANRILRQDIDAVAGTVYYFSGVTGSTQIKIYKR